jgi:hypothetical protein
MSGTIVGVTFYLDGRIQYCVQPCITPDGAFRDSQWFNECTLKETFDEKQTLGFIAETT